MYTLSRLTTARDADHVAGLSFRLLLSRYLCSYPTPEPNRPDAALERERFVSVGLCPSYKFRAPACGRRPAAVDYVAAVGSPSGPIRAITYADDRRSLQPPRQHLSESRLRRDRASTGSASLRSLRDAFGPYKSLSQKPAFEGHSTGFIYAMTDLRRSDPQQRHRQI